MQGDQLRLCEGSALYGEKISFECRKLVTNKKPIKPKHLGSSHRATGGYLEAAYCVIEKKFRIIPTIT